MKKKKKIAKTMAHKKELAISRKSVRYKLSGAEKLYFFLSSTNFLVAEGYKLFSLLEMQLSSVLLRAQLVPFFFLVSDLCFYRLVFLNGRAVSNPHFLISIYDSIQLPTFLYQVMNYRQNRFYYYPKQLLLFFKTYWGQFIDYTSDKLWLLSNGINSKVTSQTLLFATPNILLYMAPFRRFTKVYYRPQPERSRGDDVSLMYTHTVFKLKLFNYIPFYKN